MDIPVFVIVLCTIVFSALQNFGQVDDTIADEVVLLVVLVHAGNVERGGVLCVALIHQDVDLVKRKHRVDVVSTE